MENRDVLTFAGTRAGFEHGFRQFRSLLDRHHLQPGVRYRCELVFEEVVSNIIRHGYADDREHAISIAVGLRGNHVELEFEDDGVPFDPREPVPARADAPSDSDSGGRGLVLVRSVAGRLDYRRSPQHRNHLTVSIPLGRPY
jgi:serine/threonine-protein kinase RsbW